MAGSDEESPSWSLYLPLLNVLRSQSDRDLLEEAMMASQCGRYLDARAIFDEKLPPSTTIPMLAMQYADVLTDQGSERERLQHLETTLANYEMEADRQPSTEHLLLELMMLDAKFWAHGTLKGLMDKARQVRARIAMTDMDRLDDLEVMATRILCRMVC